MEKNRPTPLPDFDSLPELIEFFETQDMGEHWETMPEVRFDVEIKSKTRLVAIEEELIEKLSEIAKLRHISTEGLIHSWLKEKVG